VESNPAFMKDFLGLGGVQLGPYIVRQVVTMGGVAVIYRGEHETLHNAVAVKVLTPEVVQENLRPTLEQLFLREAQILGQLRSDDILRAHHHGRVVCPADGVERSYLVVDWLEGHTLSDEFDMRRRMRKPYTFFEVVEVLEPIARALAAAHASGIVHRDVNPRNVFLEIVPGGRLPRAKLIDFGFAKQVAETQYLHLQRVAGTLMARSPDYSTPEHYDREEYGELSENTDIYTFALMLVEALTLEPPLRGTTPEALRWATTNRQDRPTPGNRGAQVPPEIEELFAEALAVDQFERPGSILDWWQRLKHAALSAQTAPVHAVAPPAHARPPPVPVRGQHSPQSGRTPAQPSLPAPPVHPRAAFAAHPHARDDVTIPGLARRRPIGLVVAAVAGFVVLLAMGLFAWRKLAPLDCPPGFANCNGERSDGCEANLTGDVLHCGACQAACPTQTGKPTCVTGQCRVAQCPSPEQRDCNGQIADGCETNVNTDLLHCGGCGTECGSPGTKQARCVDGTCQLTCRPGYGDCDGVPGNGCETNLQENTDHCGRCGFACGGVACGEGLCVPESVSSVRAEHLAVSGSELYFYNRAARNVERIGRDGTASVVIEGVTNLTGLAAGSEYLVWIAGSPPQVFARAKQGSAAERVAGPLASETPLVVSGTGFVSWANRSPAPSGKTRGKRRAPAPAATLRDIMTTNLERPTDRTLLREAQCGSWPRTFGADDRGQYCCDQGSALTQLDCSNGACKSRAQPVACPPELVVESDQLYFAQDTRVYAFDRERRQLRQLAKRKRRPREIRVKGDHVYWLEGDPHADIWRVVRDGSAAPELLARRQINAGELSISDERVYWVAVTSPAAAGDAGAPGRTLYALPLARSAAKPAK